MFQQVLDLFAKGIVALGGFSCVVGLMGASRGYKDHNGTDMQAGIANIVNGGVMVLAAAIVSSITL